MVIIFSLVSKLIGKLRLESKIKIKSPNGEEKLIFLNNFDCLVYVALCQFTLCHLMFHSLIHVLNLISSLPCILLIMLDCVICFVKMSC